jgi:DNA-directed RNA polymerase subunit N (RpoN/RPB10)
MGNASFTTVPVRCPACGEQTHKTLESIRQNGGLDCSCGVFTALDLDEFIKQIEKVETAIKDFGVDG